MTKVKSDKIPAWFKWLIFPIVAAALSMALWQIWLILGPSIENAKRTSEIASIANDCEDDFSLLDYFFASPDSPYQTQAQLQAAERRLINWGALRARTSEIVAWIYIPNTSVDYAVTKTTNNQFYLRHDAFRRFDIAGAIYIETTHKSDFSLPDTILYGHHMRDGSKFGLLESYKNTAFREGHRYIFIYTPEYTRRFAHTDQFETPTTRIDTVERDNKVLSLITCDYTPGSSHFVVRSELYRLLLPGGTLVTRPIESEGE